MGRTANRGVPTLIGAVILPAILAAAQDGERGAPGRQSPIVLSAVSVREGKDGYRLKVVGKAKQLPEAAEVELVLRWRYQDLGSFRLTIDKSRRFAEEYPAPMITGAARDLYLRGKVIFERQPRAVREYIEKHPKVFPPGNTMWMFTFMDKKFDVGTDLELAAQEERVKQFFKETIIKMRDTDALLKRGAEDATARKRFVKGDLLDTDAWQGWLEEKIRDPVRAGQKQIFEYRKDLRFLAHRRDLNYLKEITSCIAKRSYDRSREVYQAFSLGVDPRDISPKDIDVRTKRKPKSKYILLTVNRLCESLQISLDE